jgi:hypothetical protein
MAEFVNKKYCRRFVTPPAELHILNYTYELQGGGYDESQGVCHVVATAVAQAAAVFSQAIGTR